MILYINTTLDNSLEVSLYDQDGQKTVSLVPQVDQNKSEILLRTIDEVLHKCPCGKKAEKSKTDTSKHCITGIIVVRGPKGRFSAIRAGVVCANSLAFAWNIPVVGIETDGSVEPALDQIKKLKIFKDSAIPVYEKEPGIN